MAGGLVIADRIKETAAAPGTGNVTLGGAVPGFQTFAGGGCTNNSKIYYGISDGSTKWEVGLGTWVTGPTLQRTTVLASSNGGSLENFTLAITTWGDRPAVMDLLPTQQVLTSGIGATYTTTANCRQLRIRMWGGGGGGGGSATGGGGSDGGAGGDTIFNGVHAGGGGADTGTGPAGGAGGTSVTGTANFRLQGEPGYGPASVIFSATNCFTNGGSGGGKGGGLGSNGAASTAGAANTGGGGGSAGVGGAAFGAISRCRGGGGAGEYVEVIINNPAASYTYTIGPGGSAGTAGTGGFDGALGGSGLIIVDEIYGS